MSSPLSNLQAYAAQDMTLFSLKAAIIVVALIFIVLALTVNNKWVLAGAFAYIVLP